MRQIISVSSARINLSRRHFHTVFNSPLQAPRRWECLIQDPVIILKRGLHPRNDKRMISWLRQFYIHGTGNECLLWSDKGDFWRASHEGKIDGEAGIWTLSEQIDFEWLPWSVSSFLYSAPRTVLKLLLISVFFKRFYTNTFCIFILFILKDKN